MNYYTNASAHRRSGSFLKIFVLIVCLFLFIGSLNFFQAQIKNFFHFVSSPFEKNAWRAGEASYSFLGSLVNAQNLKKEADELRSENQNLLIKITQLQNAEAENRALQELSGTDPNKEFKTVLATAMGFDSSKDLLLLNKGADDGITQDMPVISSQKVLFGRISKVYAHFSEAELISSKNSVVNAKIQNATQPDSQIYGVIRGNGGLGIFLDLIPVDSAINKGGVIMTSVLEGSFPKDLLVGVVEEAKKDDVKPFQIIKTSPFFSIKKAENLFIITDYKKQ